MAAAKRLQKEFKSLTDDPIPSISFKLKDNSLLVWDCTIKADPNSPYKNGSFNFTLVLPENFPFKAPTVTFQTKIYHPGINEEGAICIPILRDQWRPTVSLRTVLETIQNKLNEPSPDDPFEPEIAAVLKDDKTKFLATAKEWTKKYATVSEPEVRKYFGV